MDLLAIPDFAAGAMEVTTQDLIVMADVDVVAMVDAQKHLQSMG